MLLYYHDADEAEALAGLRILAGCDIRRSAAVAWLIFDVSCPAVHVCRASCELGVRYSVTKEL